MSQKNIPLILFPCVDLKIIRVDLLIEATRRIIDITGNTNIKVAIIGTGPENRN